MLELIYGTGNPGKFDYMQEMLKGLDVKLTALKEVLPEDGEPEENGRTPMENARGKAEYYYRRLKRPVFSCDNGLIIEGLPEEEQPGVHVRNVNGKRLSDAEMTAHYAQIAARLGGKCIACYQNAICLILDEEHRYEYDGEDIGSGRFYLVDQAREQKTEGFPLDPISVDIRTGRYFTEDEEAACLETENNGFRRFFEKVCEENDKKTL